MKQIHHEGIPDAKAIDTSHKSHLRRHGKKET
jgi:hypothetical protein